MRRKLYIAMTIGLGMIIFNMLLKQNTAAPSLVTETLDIIGFIFLFQLPVEYAKINKESKRHAQILNKVLEEEIAKGWPWYVTKHETQEEGHGRDQKPLYQNTQSAS